MASPAESRRPLTDYVAGIALWYGATGMQTVLFSWLVVGVLHADAATVGAVQMAHVAPVLLLLLPAGALADRIDRRRLLLALHGVAALLSAALALTVARGALTFAALVAYAVAMGSVTAFVMPARDALLSDVAGRDLMRAATALTLAQFGAQAAGTLAAGSARIFAVEGALTLQMLLMLAGGAAAWRLPRARAATAPRARVAPRDLATGLRHVARSPVMRSTMLLLSSVGLFLAGAFFVLVPILIRDVYGGDVAELSLFMGVLQGGTVLGAAFMLMGRRRPRRGTALAVSLAGSALPLLALSLEISFPWALFAAFVWGLCVAGFHSIGRAIMQEHAPAAQRASVLSVFSLGVMGAGVLGQPVSGLLAGWLGPLGALALYGAGLPVFVLLVASLTPVMRVD